MKPGKRMLGWAGFGAWLVAVVAASMLLWRYSSAPGSIGEAPSRLPAKLVTGVPETPGFVLLMAVHPKCPCSRATVAELAKILAHSPGVCRPIVFAFKPHTEPDSWIETDLCHAARRLGAEIRIDVDGSAALEMGMLTSGQVLLYDPSGQLRYQGGITSARGHQGDNQGQKTVERLLLGEDLPLSKLPVYGCSLVADSCVTT